MRPSASDTSQLSGHSKHRIIFSRNNTADSAALLCEKEEEQEYSDVDELRSNSVSFNHDPREWFKFPDASMSNYYYFCIGFSLSVSPIVATLIFAPPVIGHVAGGVGNGCLFLAYAFCSLVIAKPTVNVLGCTKSFIVGLFGNFIYVTGFLLFSQESFYMNSLAYAMVAALGGVSQGIMWTAQSKYFSKNALLMVTSMDTKEVENMHRALANRFATIYFTCLLLTIILCTVIAAEPIEVHMGIVYIVLPGYVLLVALSLVFLSRLDSFGDTGEPWHTFKPRRGLFDMFSQSRLLPPAKRSKLRLLAPYHLAWGVCTSYWIYYALGVIVLEQQGMQYIGVAAVVDLSTSLIFTKLSNALVKSMGQFPMIIWGGACMMSVGLLIILASDHSIGQNRHIVGYTLVHGMARAVYENNMKAVVADFFPEHEGLAYSATGFAKTFASGVAYLVYALAIEQRWKYGLVVTIAGAAATIGFVFSARIDGNEKREGYEHMRTISMSSAETSETLLYVAEYF
mmetsp:Transcript_15427/g.23270  ORF Transcript_15427/g.23270 Transcript_15427/m.23270 type:complete len:512 (-) Transcript_15427:185-1720(-)